MTRTLILVLTAVALVASGCGGDDEGSSPAGGGAGEAESPSAASKSGALEIKMKDFQFDPKSATVKAGQEVKWVNEDTADHDVTDEKTGLFESKQLGQGGTFTFTAKKAGTIEYVCTLHPGMTGKLTVTG
jgi:plastocyanin